MAKITKSWLLVFFLSYFFITPTNNLCTSTDTEQAQAYAFLGTSAICLGIFNFFLSATFFAFSNHNETDIPVTHEENMFFVLRNFLPKEELDRLLAHKKNVAENQKEIGHVFLGLGLICVVAGCSILTLQDTLTSLESE